MHGPQKHISMQPLATAVSITQKQTDSGGTSRQQCRITDTSGSQLKLAVDSETSFDAKELIFDSLKGSDPDQPLFPRLPQ